MNQVVEEMKAILDGEETLIHYGMPRRSGRYPWGSGEDGYQHNQDFLSRVEDMRKKGVTYTDPKTGKTYKGDTAIAKTMGLSTTQFRTEIGLAKDERRILQVNTAKALQSIISQQKLTSEIKDQRYGNVLEAKKDVVDAMVNLAIASSEGSHTKTREILSGYGLEDMI